MKKNALLIVLLITYSCNNSIDSKNSSPYSQPDSANFAILFVKPPSYEFGGGGLYKYEICNGCNNDSLPLTASYIYPGPADEEGIVSLVYTETGDTIFHSTYGPWGVDEVFIPSEIMPPDSFVVYDSIASSPNIKQLFNSWFITNDSLYQEKADSSWNTIKYLDIVHDFAGTEYLMGFIAYSVNRYAIILYCEK